MKKHVEDRTVEHVLCMFVFSDIMVKKVKKNEVDKVTVKLGSLL